MPLHTAHTRNGISTMTADHVLVRKLANGCKVWPSAVSSSGIRPKLDVVHIIMSAMGWIILPIHLS